MKKSTTGLFGILVLLLASLWMTGCQDLKNVKESTVTVDKKGAVTEALVEDFSAENYDAEELKDVKGDIQFDHVSFRYSGVDEDVLTNINLHVAPGQNIALVGPSGGGKTTLCNLIPRFYEVTSGRILIDGQDIKKITLQSLRNQIGTVQQEVYLFSGTIYENIGYGKPGATQEEIIRAAKLAGAHEFIADLPDGYNTYVGERGVKLSGGQKQRVSIARVFLKNPPVLILDEATAFTDPENEDKIQSSIMALSKGKTLLVIAHRLSTIQNADQIVVLEKGHIVDQGTQAELLRRCLLYQKLWQAHIGAQGWAVTSGAKEGQ